MKSREEDTLILRTLKQRPVALSQPEGNAHFVFNTGRISLAGQTKKVFRALNDQIREPRLDSFELVSHWIMASLY
jgi:hypothetical protein